MMRLRVTDVHVRKSWEVAVEYLPTAGRSFGRGRESGHSNCASEEPVQLT